MNLEARTRHEAEPIATPTFPAFLAREIERLRPEHRLLESGGFTVYLAPAAEIPLTVHEIGRLREEAFRAVGEGTGQAIDVDRFDASYLHLFIWNREAHEVVGAYRIGLTDQLLASQGVEGLYTSTLFHYRPEVLSVLSPALELGRSFVRLEYQKSYSALLLLWKGIGEFLVRNPRYRRLIGAVSVSDLYDRRSQRLIVEVLRRHYRWLPWSSQVRARRPPRFAELEAIPVTVGADIEALDHAVLEIEQGRRGLPILLRQYLRLGGKFLGFNVDPSFGNTLDGLVVVDLLEADRRSLERYMTRAGAERFFAFHEARREQRRQIA